MVLSLKTTSPLRVVQHLTTHQTIERLSCLQLTSDPALTSVITLSLTWLTMLLASVKTSTIAKCRQIIIYLEETRLNRPVRRCSLSICPPVKLLSNLMGSGHECTVCRKAALRFNGKQMREATLDTTATWVISLRKAGFFPRIKTLMTC